MVKRFHEIAESDQKLFVPLSSEKMMRLGHVCKLSEETRVLDLGSGKGELLIQWARNFHIKGTGVDVREEMVEVAQQHADDMEVWSQVNFVNSDLGDYVQPYHQYHVVTHLATVPFGGNLVTTIEYMKDALRAHETGLLVIGETFWEQSPPSDLFDSVAIEASVVPHMGQISDALDEADVDLLDLVLADKREMDIYQSQQWRSTLNWLQTHPEDPERDDVIKWLRESRRNYLKFEREYLGWGVFVIAVEGTGE